MLTHHIRTILKQPLSVIVGILLYVLAVSNSCVAPTQVVLPEETNRIMAENSQMKKRLPLIERENDVLKQENIQYKAKVRQSAATIEKLSFDLSALNEKFAREIVLGEERVKNLQASHNLLESESATMLTELTEFYKELELKLNQQIQTLTQKSAMEKAAFEKQMDEVRQAGAQRESELLRKLDEAKKTLATRDSEIAALQSINHEIATKLQQMMTPTDTTPPELNPGEKKPPPVTPSNSEPAQKPGGAFQAPKPQVVPNQ